MALVPEGYRLEELLDDRSLTVNDVKFQFVSIHLVPDDGSSTSFCRHLPFVRLLTGIGYQASITQDSIMMAVDYATRSKIRRIDIYRLRNAAVVYFTEDFGGISPGFESYTLTIGESEVKVKKVCMLQDIQPSASDNELRLSRFQVCFAISSSVRTNGGDSIDYLLSR